MSKESKSKVVDEFLDKINKEGIDEIVIFGINSENREQCVSVMKARNAHSGTAMVGMLIKLLSDEIDVPSYDLAKVIGEKLKQTEEEIEKLVEKEKKKTLHIKITTDEN